MKLITLIVFFLFNESTVTYVDFNKDYFFICEKLGLHFNPDIANRIMFNEDGTYVREEDISTTRVNEYGEIEHLIIKITEMVGTWEKKGSTFVLNDKRVNDYKVMTFFGEVVDATYEENDMQFGLQEYLTNARISEVSDEMIFYTNGNRDMD